MRRRARRGVRFRRSARFPRSLIRTAEQRHRFVLTNHHIVLDGWSLPILLREIFTSYCGQRLPAAGSYRSFLPGWPNVTSMPPARPGAKCWPASRRPPWSAHRMGWGQDGVASTRFGCPQQTTRALSEVARVVPHHRQHRAAGRLGAAVDLADRSA